MKYGPPRKCNCGQCSLCKRREVDIRYRKRHPEKYRQIHADYLRNNPEKRRQFNRTALLAPGGRAKRQTHNRDYHHRNRIAIYVAKVERYKDSPGKRRAWLIVQSALRNGTLLKEQCSQCGSPVAVAHHDDYRKPLTVRWLCRICHAEVHGITKTKL